MIIDKKQVVEELYRAILKGYNPHYDYESACDHRVDWTVLTHEKFDHISKKAQREKEKKTQNTAKKNQNVK